MQTKKTPTKLGSMAGDLTNLQRYFIHRDGADASGIKTIAHPACTMSGTGQFERGLNFQEMFHHAGAILATSPKGMVCRNTFVIRLNRPESAVLSCPNSVTGLWADGPFREAGRTAITSVTNICPPAFARNEAADSKTRYRSMTMPKSTTKGALPTTTHDHHQAALVLRAQNHLALALFELRNSTGDTPTRRAMGLAYAAARSLSQVVGGAV